MGALFHVSSRKNKHDLTDEMQLFRKDMGDICTNICTFVEIANTSEIDCAPDRKKEGQSGALRRGALIGESEKPVLAKRDTAT